jgi:hypothetical protein
MLVMIEFFRIRETDKAQALVGRETVEVADLNDAIAMGRRLGLTLHMPQRPDALAIMDHEGQVLYAGALDAPTDRPARNETQRASPHRFRGGFLYPQNPDRELARWENEGGSTGPFPPKLSRAPPVLGK